MATGLPRPDANFKELFDDLDQKVRNENPDISSGSLGNAHGDWYQWLIAISAWNHRLKLKELGHEPYLALLLPKRSSLVLSNMYTTELAELVDDLRLKVLESAQVELITSNPDLILINAADLAMPDIFEREISFVTPQEVDCLDRAYTSFLGKCQFQNIVGYLSVKFSFRPDRRLQIPHEGSLTKAVYIHLQTRQWIIGAPGLKYYACAAKLNAADITALKTVATHSLTSVQSVPEAAVDDVFQIDSFQSAEQVWNQILLPPATEA